MPLARAGRTSDVEKIPRRASGGVSSIFERLLPLRFLGARRGTASVSNAAAAGDFLEGPPPRPARRYLDGFHGDCSEMFYVGEVDARSRDLVEVTYECWQRAIEICEPGRPYQSRVR